MKTTRLLAFCAALAASLILPGRAPAQESEGSDESAVNNSDEAPATGSAATEAEAPAMDEAKPAPAPRKRAKRNHPRPSAARDPDGGGGGRELPPSDDDDGPDSSPLPPQGTPSPDSMGCDMPPLHHINVHFMGGNGSRLRADATPIVCSTDAGTKHERYCQKTMNDPNRRCCPAKPEGHPLRVACELVLLGKDPSDGVPGPRWQYVGRDPNGGVDKHPENPFLAFAYGGGVARACSNVVNICGEAPYQVPARR